MTGEERLALVGLWCARGVGARSIARVREVFRDQLGAIAHEPTQSWLSAVLLPEPAREGLRALASLAAHAEAVLDQADRSGIQVTFVGDPTFPRGLERLPSAPPLLFFQGRGDRLDGRRRLATVGSRHFETGQAEVLYDFARQLATQLILVSGAADGVDQLCHRAALKVGGETWAFMGAGLDRLDRSQAAIAPRIVDGGGTVFSEFPPGVGADTTTFPRRNRLIAGASDAVLLLRASVKSGALITARRALEQGQRVLALPGQVGQVTAAGCNSMIRHGLARLVGSAADVFAELGLAPDEAKPAGQAEPPRPPVDLASLSAAARAAFGALERSPLDFDLLLARAAPIDSGQLASALIELELEGLLVRRPGQRYERR